MAQKPENSTFTKDQEIFIIEQFSIFKSPTAVKRRFLAKFRDTLNFNWLKSLQPKNFQRVYDRFLNNGIASTPHSQHIRGVEKTDPEKITLIQNYFIEKPMNSLHQAEIDIKIPTSTLSRILRQKLKFKPYKFTLSQMLNEAQKSARLKFCEWLLSQPTELIFDIIFNDEKWFQLNQHPNHQNTRYWGVAKPNFTLNLKNLNVTKIMCFVIIVQGQAFLYWHVDENGKNVSVNSAQYIKSVIDLLENLPIGKLKSFYWWSQDGAPPHTSKLTMDFLKKIFGNRIISRQLKNFKIPDVPEWPPHSPDLNPLDYSFWGQAMQKVWEAKPSNINELKSIVENFFVNLSPDFVKKCVANIQKRATLCVQQKGGHFEHLI